ncbi:MAG TPA: arginase family protein [Acidobacteriota bacterium]
MEVEIIVVPYDSGHRDRRMGRGPGRIITCGLIETLKRAGHTVTTHTLEAPGNFHTEISAAFQLNALIANAVKQALERNRFPIVLSGNCICSLGVMAALTPQNPGVVWFDAHGDLNTPETTISGFLDGMALAALTGRCFRALSGGIPDFQPIADSKILLVGARDLDGAEMDLLRSSKVRWIPPQEIDAQVPSALTTLKEQTEKVHLHFDLDVLDPQYARANQYSAPNGLTPQQLLQTVQDIRKRFEITSVCIAAYDPEFDPESKIAEVASDLMLTLLA